MPADETTALTSPTVKEVSSWLPMCCKWGYAFFFYSLTLVVEWGIAIFYIYRYIQYIHPFTPWAWEDVNVTGTKKTNDDAFTNGAGQVNHIKAALALISIDKWNCLMFLVIIGIFYKTRHADNSTSHAHRSTSPCKLVKFWFLILELVLYLTGALLLIFSYLIIPHDVKFKTLNVVGYSLMIVNAILMVGMVVSLNNVKVQSLAQGNSHYIKYVLQADLFG